MVNNRIDAKFEKISKYANDPHIVIPTRSTEKSSGYDFCAAKDTVIEPYKYLLQENFDMQLGNKIHREEISYDEWRKTLPYTIDRIGNLIKAFGARIPLVPTGIKCKMPDNFYLQLSIRSSIPYKHWLLLGNGVGVIDSDYYNNEDNEGEIFFQIINFTSVPIVIRKGDCFGQGIILPYYICQDDNAKGARKGGLGSTSKKK